MNAHAKIKKQYKNGYVQRPPAGVRRGRRPGLLVIPHLNPVLLPKLINGQAATADQVAQELETGGTKEDLNAAVVHGTFARKKAYAEQSIRPVAAAFESYCSKNKKSVARVLVAYDSAIEPSQLDRVKNRAGMHEGEVISEVASASGLSERVVRSAFSGETLPSDVCALMAKTVSALGWGSIHPVAFHSATWHTFLPGNKAALWDIAEWYVNN